MGIHIQNISQIGIVVKDLYAKIKTYEEVYHIGPWKIMDGIKGFDGEAEGLTVRGKPAPYKISMATAMVGNVEIELIQPLDDISEYADFMKKHGEGVQHISIVTDAKEFKQAMTGRGVETAIWGHVPGVETFEYFDTVDDIGVVIETHDPD